MKALLQAKAPAFRAYGGSCLYDLMRVSYFLWVRLEISGFDPNGALIFSFLTIIC